MLKFRIAALAAAFVLPASLALLPPASAQQKTTIGVSLAQDDNPFYIAMLRGIRGRAQELGWDVATVSANEEKLKQMGVVECFESGSSIESIVALLSKNTSNE